MRGVRERLLPWVDELPRRSLAVVSTVVLHATEEPTLADARRLAEASDDRVAGHLYLDRDGAAELWVPLDREARHAAGHNAHSLGIELVNLGRHPDHFASGAQEPTEPFPSAQVASLEVLLRLLRDDVPSLTTLARHSDLDRRLVPASDDASRQVRRRIDPGPLFPWDRVRRSWDEGPVR